MKRAAPIVAAGAVLSAVGLAMLAGGLAFGSLVILVGLAIVGTVSRTWLIALCVVVLPISNIGWSLRLLTLDGRSFDARLTLTFGLAVLLVAFMTLDLARRRSHLEYLMAAFVAYLLANAMLNSVSLYTWAPYAARWITYFAAFSLARRAFVSPESYRSLAIAAIAGFSVPSGWGLFEFFSGQAETINGATRATSLADAGPIALAFSGQLVLLLTVLTLAPDTRRRGVAIAVALLGAAAIITSATRIVLATAWAGTAAPLALRRQWRVAAAVTLIAGSSLIIRPDFLGRFVDALHPVPAPSAGNATAAPSSPITPGSGGEPNSEQSQGSDTDASFRFRLFVWSTLFEEWRDSPVIGAGPGMTATIVSSVSKSQRTAPHNDYVGVLGELGLMGLGLFLAIQISVLLALVQGRRSDAHKVRHGAGNPRLTAAVLFLAFDVFGALNNPMYFLDVQVAIWAIVGAGLAVWTSSQSSPETDESQLIRPE